MSLKGYFREQLFQFGYDVRRREKNQLGFNPHWDMAKLATRKESAVLFDVGANNGQTISELRKRFTNPIIHAFEPSPSTYPALVAHTAGTPNLHLRNFALGSNCEQRLLQENSVSALTSLLPQGEACWGEIVNTTQVNVRSLDSYCKEEGIAQIEVLKSDTQGFDLEVLKGGIGLLSEHRVHQIFIELNFCEIYQGMARFEEIYAFLRDLGIAPVAFYNQQIRDSILGWTDGLFVDPKYKA
jgi:FkbM family methyltransferase